MFRSAPSRILQKKLGLPSHRAAKKPLLTSTMRKKRLALARKTRTVMPLNGGHGGHQDDEVEEHEAGLLPEAVRLHDEEAVDGD